MSPEVLDFHRDSAVLHRAVLASETVVALCRMFEPQLSSRPGRRLSEGDWASVAFEGPLTQIAVGRIGAGARPVRAVVFDKTPETNWSVAWHQDRTIVVRSRIAVEGFGPWSVKDGLIHVEPPVSVLEGMVTLRLHLDDCRGGQCAVEDRARLAPAWSFACGGGGRPCGTLAGFRVSGCCRRCLGLFDACSSRLSTVAAHGTAEGIAGGLCDW